MPDNLTPEKYFTIEDAVKEGIRTAVYGRDVRKALADGLIICYDDAEGAAAIAKSAADNANTAAAAANTAAGNANSAATKISTIEEVNTSTLTPGSSAAVSVVIGNEGVTFNFSIPKGDTGDNAYVYIRYAANEPASDSDMKTTPDKWIGIYSGSASTAPTTYTSYTWYKIKGETGSITNAYASTIYMSEQDQQHTIKNKIDALEGKIVYTSNPSGPDNPVEGMIWLKPAVS